MDGHDSVQLVVFTGEQAGDFESVHLFAQGAHLRPDFLQNAFALSSQLKVSFKIGEFRGQALVSLYRGFQAFALSKDLLRILLVFPEVGAGYLLFDGFQFAALSGGVKENSEVPGLDASGRQILLSVLQSRMLLEVSLNLGTLPWPETRHRQQQND